MKLVLSITIRKGFNIKNLIELIGKDLKGRVKAHYRGATLGTFTTCM
jgi:hypothetical protein